MNSPAHPRTLAQPPDAADHVRGNPRARVTLVEYGDFECPSCKVAAPTPTLLLERYPEKIRFIFRHFPLEAAHPHALLAAEAAEAAAAQGRFWEMHDVLFGHQAHLKGKDLRRYAEQLGLDAARFTAELDGHAHLGTIRAQMAGGEHSHIRATPTFFLDGVVQDISFGMQALHDAVEAAVARR